MTFQVLLLFSKATPTFHPKIYNLHIISLFDGVSRFGAKRHVFNEMTMVE